MSSGLNATAATIRRTSKSGVTDEPVRFELGHQDRLAQELVPTRGTGLGGLFLPPLVQIMESCSCPGCGLGAVKTVVLLTSLHCQTLPLIRDPAEANSAPAIILGLGLALPDFILQGPDLSRLVLVQ